MITSTIEMPCRNCDELITVIGHNLGPGVRFACGCGARYKVERVHGRLVAKQRLGIVAWLKKKIAV